jgi:acetyltransferase-like isoleucine patch superfamily enzyme
VFAIPRDVLYVSLVRSLCLSVRYHGRIVVLRGTRLRLERGARIEVPRGCRLLIGKSHVAGAPASLHMMRDARLTVTGQGRVAISRGARIVIMQDAHLEVGGETTINYNSAVTCGRRISIAPFCAISWNVNILDGNLHELIVDGVTQPRSRPVVLGRYAWIGCGATIIGATVGTGAVVGAGSVVASDVPDRVVVAGNPARIVRKNVAWRA